MSGEKPIPQPITHKISNPETKGRLTVEYRPDTVVRNGIGALFALHRSLLIGSPSDAFIPPDSELAKQLFDAWKDVPWKGDVLVRVGGSDIETDIKRFREFSASKGLTEKKKKKIEKNLHKQSSNDLLFRRSYYNPYTQTVVVHDQHLAFAMHEMGHAWDHDTSGSIPKGLQAEWRASAFANSRMNPADRKMASRYLEPAFATYVGNRVGIVAAVVADLLLGAKKASKERITPLHVVGAVAAGPIASYLTVVLGHIHARLPWRKSSFGYIFSGEVENHPNLSSNQMYVATAKV